MKLEKCFHSLEQYLCFSPCHVCFVSLRSLSFYSILNFISFASTAINFCNYVAFCGVLTYFTPFAKFSSYTMQEAENQFHTGTCRKNGSVREGLVGWGGVRWGA